MDKKGFTLVELLATIVILGIVVGITIVAVNVNANRAREMSEEVFVKSIGDAISAYLDSPYKQLSFTELGCYQKNTTGKVAIYKAEINFNDVISLDHLMEQSDLVNPSSGDDCALASNIPVTIYRDSNFVYYYKINKSDFGCFGDSTGTINNLPDDFNEASLTELSECKS